MAVNQIRTRFYDAIGIQYSPSKVELVKNKAANENATESELSVDGIPLYPSAEVDEMVARIPGSWSQTQILDFLKTEFKKQTGSTTVGAFWFTCVEAVARVRPDDITTILDVFGKFLAVAKLDKKQRLYHSLFLELFKLRMELCRTASTGLLEILSNLEISKFRSVYTQLSSLELRAAAKTRVATSTVSFVLQDVFPFFIRDIPVSFLEKISGAAFDLDITPDDVSKLWSSDLNAQLPKGWRTRHRLHRWDESFSKSQKRFVVDEPLVRNDSEAVAVVYEAPWIPPTLAKNDQSTAAQPRRQSVTVPARALKMEGRRQSYKPSPNDAPSSDALCVVHEAADDGFMISRGVLDAMRDWNHDEMQPTNCMLSDQPIGDVLLDLLHSPPQPSTRVTTPVKESKKRSIDETPKSTKRARRSPARDPASGNRENISPHQLASSFLLESNVSTISSQDALNRKSLSPKTVLKAPKVPKSDEKKTDRADRRRIRDEADYHTLNLI